MRIVYRSEAGERIVELEFGDRHALVKDLQTALGISGPLVLDGQPISLESRLSGVALCEGSVLESVAPQAAPSPTARMLVIVGGIRAGGAHSFSLTEAVLVGRDSQAGLPLADPTVSRRQCSISVNEILEHGSRNGTSVDGHEVPPGEPVVLPEGGVVRAGATRIMLRAPCDDRPVAVVNALGAAGGTIPFNRPPRCLPDVAPPELIVPPEAPEVAKTEPLSVAGIVLPVIAGLVIALVLSPLFAVFAALGPVVTIGTWWERRRRNRRDHRLAVAELEAELATLAAELPVRRVAEMARRRGLHPDPAEVIRRAQGPSVHCWERRGEHPDAFRVAVGASDEAFAPTMLTSQGQSPAGQASVLVAQLPPMSDVPLEVDLSAGRVIGLLGDRSAALSVARALVLQAVVHHGPADLAVAVGADDPMIWDWCRWLPHTADHGTARRGATVVSTADVATADALLAINSDRSVLAVIDGADPFQGRLTVGRRLLSSQRCAAIVLVEDAHRLPADCDLVVTVDYLGRLELLDPRHHREVRTALGWGVEEVLARQAARRLARLDDPELPLLGAGVPGACGLLSLLGISGDDETEILRRWQRTQGGADIATPIGVDAQGPVMLDLVADGPHVLIGGTTGAGKSELLRSFVAGVAASHDPDHVAMVLVDYKGGAAFDCCADLPHVAGLVTDLDEQLAARALRCLEAELRYRELRLRGVGAEDLAAFRLSLAQDGDESSLREPLPRLLVVVDEFASLAADLPEFLDALVGIAQRGRSLGVHMLLATQRPTGVVTDDIRANASCRIALRVSDPRESVDIIDVGDAAGIPRNRPGRAIARFGPGEITPFQSALATGHSRSLASVSVRSAQTAASNLEGPTDLWRLVTTIRSAHRRVDGQAPRSPWPPALPKNICRAQLGDWFGACRAPASAEVSAGWLLVDEPDKQKQSVSGWNLADGHLVVVGAPGTGATTTLATAALAVTADSRGCGAHLQVIDFDGGGIASLGRLAHCGTVATVTDKERRVRLLRWLDEEIARRRADEQRTPPLLLVIDDLGGLGRAHDPIREQAVHEALERIWADGPAVGVVVAVSVRRAADLPLALAATAGTVLLHRLAETSDALRFGVKVPTETFPNGRVLRVGDAVIAQVVKDLPSLEESVMARKDSAPPLVKPHQVGVLAAVITQSQAGAWGRVGSTETDLAVAVSDRDLSLSRMRLHRGEHALILGPARSGRSNTLIAIASACGGRCVIVGDAAQSAGEIAARTGGKLLGVEALGEEIATGPLLVLVDDCLSVADPSGQLAQLVASPPAGVHLVVAAKPDQLRSAYGHWSVDIRASKVGILLRPDPIDGDLLGVTLPARLALRNVAGRGVLVADSEFEVVQVVCAEDAYSFG